MRNAVFILVLAVAASSLVPDEASDLRAARAVFDTTNLDAIVRHDRDAYAAT